MSKFENLKTDQSVLALPLSRELQPNREGFYTIYGKRMFDIVFALTLLPILFLFFVGLSILNFRDGKTLFAQERIGKNGKAYKCLKFRTMVIDAEQRLIEYCKNNPDAAKEWEVFQ